MMKPTYLSLSLAVLLITAASLIREEPLPLLEAHSTNASRLESHFLYQTLERRKGGGGKGGISGGGKKGGGNSGGTHRTSPSSNQGGLTRQGSGPSRSYGAGYYGGGASVPYTSGQKSPKGLLPGLVIGSAAALIIFPGVWLHRVYPYYYNNPYHFYNSSLPNATQQSPNDALPVVCLCQEYSVCGCDENNDRDYLKDLVGNASYAALNKTLITVSEVNNTHTWALVLNGTLPNGTTAPGGTEGAAAHTESALPFGRFSGYYAMGILALYAIALL